ncbi:tRNA lysidine(34) synthetase TilS [Mycoplasmopsis opalescens]|uniref:tRNA lysidine(34) synthetase TilS n=1 Tax=Mycoplasmopsis opalescens TaxID=114886 RepID=UPI0004A6FB83|nr:tRNA lysidine(34) synthetase TilS [Mycoplasmopsis opalescens]
MEKIAKQNNKILLAVSGGPDSVFLCHYIKERFDAKNVIVATVDHSVRENSHRDVEIVKRVCEKYNFELKICKLDPVIAQSWSSGFEEKAREARYKFFKEIYDKEKCEALYLGHHKDDFIETVIMQKKSKREPLFYGIKPSTVLLGMNIIRPFIDKYFKNEILKLCSKLKLEYAIDETNSNDCYQRNVIRKKLLNKSVEEKNRFINQINLENEILLEKEKKVNLLYEQWKNNNFNLTWIKNLDKSNDFLLPYLVSKMIFTQTNEKINLNKDKLLNIISWIKSNKNNKTFLLKDNIKMVKQNKEISFLINK